MGAQLRKPTSQWPIEIAARRAARQGAPPTSTAFAAYGPDSWIVPPAHVEGADAMSIGADVVVMEHSRLVACARGRVPTLSIGDRVRLARFAVVVASISVVLEEGVASSDNVVISDSWTALAPGGHRALSDAPAPAPIVVERGAYIGCNAVILPGVRVGANAYVGEGAVVAADVAPRTVVYGNPARPVRSFDERTRSWLDEVAT